MSQINLTGIMARKYASTRYINVNLMSLPSNKLTSSVVVSHIQHLVYGSTNH